MSIFANRHSPDTISLFQGFGVLDECLDLRIYPAFLKTWEDYCGKNTPGRISRGL